MKGEKEPDDRRDWLIFFSWWIFTSQFPGFSKNGTSCVTISSRRGYKRKLETLQVPCRNYITILSRGQERAYRYIRRLVEELLPSGFLRTIVEVSSGLQQ